MIEREREESPTLPLSVGHLLFLVDKTANDVTKDENVLESFGFHYYRYFRTRCPEHRTWQRIMGSVNPGTSPYRSKQRINANTAGTSLHNKQDVSSPATTFRVLMRGRGHSRERRGSRSRDLIPTSHTPTFTNPQTGTRTLFFGRSLHIFWPIRGASEPQTRKRIAFVMIHASIIRGMFTPTSAHIDDITCGYR